ncbi:MAG TPA: hypothetical protein VII56_22820 [Rhizomicrobium sp.]
MSKIDQIFDQHENDKTKRLEAISRRNGLIETMTVEIVQRISNRLTGELNNSERCRYLTIRIVKTSSDAATVWIQDTDPPAYWEESVYAQNVGKYVPRLKRRTSGKCNVTEIALENLRYRRIDFFRHGWGSDGDINRGHDYSIVDWRVDSDTEIEMPVMNDLLVEKAIETVVQNIVEYLKFKAEFLERIKGLRKPWF